MKILGFWYFFVSRNPRSPRIFLSGLYVPHSQWGWRRFRRFRDFFTNFFAGISGIFPQSQKKFASCTADYASDPPPPLEAETAKRRAALHHRAVAVVIQWDEPRRGIQSTKDREHFSGWVATRVNFLGDSLILRMPSRSRLRW